MRTYFDNTTGMYIGSWNWPATPEQLNHPDLAGHLWKDGQVGSGLHRLNVTTGELELLPLPALEPTPTLVEQILASPEDLSALKRALGL